MELTQEELQQVIMELIINGGDAKSCAMEAIYAAKEKSFKEAEKRLLEANDALNRAHRSQTDLFTQEAGGNTIALSLLMIHGQDHLMNAITFKDLAAEVVDIYKKIET